MERSGSVERLVFLLTHW